MGSSVAAATTGSARDDALAATALGGVLAAILRDIARGGLASLVVGFLVAGVGGRLVMRLAALLVPEADGLFTENGFRIGTITLEGSVALLIFEGLGVTMVLGVIWVVISPWLPGAVRGSVTARALAATPMAIAFATPILVDEFNPDFLVLQFNPMVVASLVGLVALTAPAMALADSWLERRLPRPADVRSVPGVVYLVLAVIGGLMGGFLLVLFAGEFSAAMGASIVLTGCCTLAWWVLRVRGHTAPPRALGILARAILVVGTVVGLVQVVPEVLGALDA